jgi:hypothetical protein
VWCQSHVVRKHYRWSLLITQRPFCRQCCYIVFFCYNLFIVILQYISVDTTIWYIYLTSIYLLTYLLTYSMVQSSSWAANWFAAGQEIPRISPNPKVHHRTHKCRPPVPILGQPNPTSWRSILILSTHLRLGLPSGLFPSGYPTKTPLTYSYEPHAQPISFFFILSPARCYVNYLL